MNWRQLDIQSHEQNKLIQDLTVKIEAKVAEQRHVGAELENQREQQVEVNGEFNVIQVRYYALGADIARAEQIITHHRERFTQLQNEQVKVEQNWQKLQQHLTIDQQHIQQFTDELVKLRSALTAVQRNEILSCNVLARAEQTMQEWQNEYDRFNQKAAEIMQKTRVEQTRIEYLEQKIVTAEKYLARIQAEQSQINLINLEKHISELNQQHVEWNTKIKVQQNLLADVIKKLSSQRYILEKLIQTLDEVRNRVQTAHVRSASLQALQQAALGSGSGSAKQWLQAQQLIHQARLAQKLTVSAGWELAVETVLGSYLEAVCVDDIKKFVRNFAGFSEGEVILFDTQSSVVCHHALPADDSLAKHVHSDYAVQTLLTSIYCADQTKKFRCCLGHAPTLGKYCISRYARWYLVRQTLATC